MSICRQCQRDPNEYDRFIRGLDNERLELRAEVERLQRRVDELYDETMLQAGALGAARSRGERLRETVRRVPIDEIADRLSGTDTRTAYLRTTLYELREATEETER